MPKIFNEAGYRFFFYSNEGAPLEPIHIHVAKSGADAKIWLQPIVRVASSDGLSPRELRKVMDIVIRRSQEIEDAWTAHFT
jgi:hypothetical protein